MSRSLFNILSATGSSHDLPLPRSLRQKLKDGLVALSLANLCLMSASSRVLAVPDGELSYYVKLPLTHATLLGLVANLLWSATLIWLGIRAWRRCRSRWLNILCEWLFLLVLLVPLDFCRSALLGISEREVLAFLRRPMGALGVLLLLVCAAWQRRRIVRLAVIVIGIMSPLAFIVLAQIALLSFGPHHPPHQLSEPVPPPLHPVREGQPRVVWVVLDEADQRLALEQRPARLRTPELDRLRSESIYATNAYPPGTATPDSMPELISGRCFSAASAKNAFEFEVTLANTGESVSWNELPSVFDSARELGFNTALVGWFHPYSRTLGRSLNFCVWYPLGLYQPVRALTVREAMRNELRCLVWSVHLRKLHAETCREVLVHSLSVVTNATYGLVLLHLPVPHKPWVFDASTGRFTFWYLSAPTGYFGNLALADLVLGKLRQAMETSGQWDKTWLIVSADHSWRDSPQYDGRRDLRVPFLIKPPGYSQPANFSSEINTVLTHDLVLAILHGDLTNQEQTVAWLEAHPNTPTHGQQPLKGANGSTVDSR